MKGHAGPFPQCVFQGAWCVQVWSIWFKFKGIAVLSDPALPPRDKRRSRHWPDSPADLMSKGRVICRRAGTLFREDGMRTGETRPKSFTRAHVETAQSRF